MCIYYPLSYLVAVSAEPAPGSRARAGLDAAGNTRRSLPDTRATFNVTVAEL